jgi:hypothetical protein
MNEAFRNVGFGVPLVYTRGSVAAKRDQVSVGVGGKQNVNE